MKQTNFWKTARNILINKYAITLYVFAVLLIFVGDQSLINQVSRTMEIRKIKQTIQHEQAAATQAIRTLESLENPDSLERFAREQYNMHADGEDAYIIHRLGMKELGLVILTCFLLSLAELTEKEY